MSGDPANRPPKRPKPRPEPEPDLESYGLADADEAPAGESTAYQPVSQPPPKPRPRPKPAPRPEAPRYDFLDDEDPEGEGTSTFRPAPSGPSAQRRPEQKPPRRAPAADRLPVGDPEFDDMPRAPKSSKGRPSIADSPPEKGGGLTERILLGRVSSGQLSHFCRQFSVYLNSGVGLTRALDSLSKQYKGTALGPVTDRLGVAVRRGETLTEAASREPQAFDALFLSMIRVAEARGGVPEVLRSLSAHYEARQRMVRQARSAMIYPTAVILITLAVGGLLTMFVLPKLVEILRDLSRGRGVELPLPTRMLMALSDFIQAYGWWLIPAAVAGGGFALIRSYKTPKGKAVLDEVALRVPVMGKLLRMIDTARFSRSMADLLDAGVDMPSSLGLTADTLHLAPYQRSIRDMRRPITHGSELSTLLQESGRFEPDVLAYVESGEETGNLPESLDRLATDYEERVNFMVKNLGSLIQPLIIIVLGSIVGFVVLAFIMAYISVIANLSSGL